jgi:hypothetical protein
MLCYGMYSMTYVPRMYQVVPMYVYLYLFIGVPFNLVAGIVLVCAVC